MLSTSCGPRRITLPTDAGTPLPDFDKIGAQVFSACTGVRTLTAELSLSGNAGRQKLRGRVLAGFKQPASMRLEGIAPFGQPGFILAGEGSTATLLLPRDQRVLRGASAPAILGALVGVMLGPADLQAILTGCVVPQPKVTAGRLYRNGWASLTVNDGSSPGMAMVYVRQQSGVWQITVARRSDWDIEYRAWQAGSPRDVRLRSMAGDVDLAATISQLEANVDIDPAAFTVQVPAGTSPITLEELRDSGPLRGE